MKIKKQIEKKKKLILFTYLFSIFMFKDSKNKILKSPLFFSTFKNSQPIFLNVEKKLHKRNLELGGTLIPAIILFIIGAPSLSVLYSISELIAPELTIKAIGNQGFWTYEYSLYFGETPELVKSFEKERDSIVAANRKYLKERPFEKHRRFKIETIVEEYGKKTLFYNAPRNAKFRAEFARKTDFGIYKEFNMGPHGETGKLRTYNLSPDSLKPHKYFIWKQRVLIETLLLDKLRSRIREFMQPTLPHKLVYESHMILEDELKKGELRLLEVDYGLILPINVEMRLLVSSADVIHSFAVPSLGIKVDGVPGRTNEVPVFIKRKGIFYGQCSELCGVNHGFMPIVVQAVNKNAFLDIMITILGGNLKEILGR